MREIKFRAWDIQGNKMLPEIKEIELKHGNIVSLREPWCDDVEDAGYYEVMQYTGLKDKNGKEIYEGDIIETYAHTSKFEVKWHDDYDGELGGTSGWPLNRREAEQWEVIGNVYENPELIKQQ